MKVEVPMYFVESNVSVHPARWRNCWWVRLFRWIYYRLVKVNPRGKVLFFWMKFYRLVLPFWLEELILAEYIHFSQSLRQLPLATVSRIQVMKTHLEKQGIAPTMVLIGIDTYHDLVEELSGYGDYYPQSFCGRYMHERVLGLRLQFSPFLEKGDVIVC